MKLYRGLSAARGEASGYETIDNLLALSGPTYYRQFHDVVMKLVTQEGINQFKFDGTGNANKVGRHKISVPQPRRVVVRQDVNCAIGKPLV